jgi:hypothetical protein
LAYPKHRPGCLDLEPPRIVDLLADLAAGRKDLDDEVVGSHLGANYQKAPFGVLRAFNVVVVGLIVLAELMAIY